MAKSNHQPLKNEPKTVRKLPKRKQEEHAKAFKLYMQGMTQREIAEILEVSEKTISAWAKDGNWETARAAQMFSEENLAQNNTAILVMYSNRQLDLMRERDKLLNLPKGTQQQQKENSDRVFAIQEELSRIADAVSKLKKDQSKQERHLDIITYLEVTKSIFKALQLEDPKLHAQTIDFQERHIQEMAKKLG
ncbi:putative ATPase subunit of terminase (gpP-like) [compost metagenome]